MGNFIVFEGPDKAGKSTVHKKLQEEYPEIVFTREPGGLNNPTAERIREVILDKSLNINPICEAYLYAASRAQHTYMIQELLDVDKTVITDRFIQSSMVYQGLTRQIPLSMIIEINKHACNGLWPKAVFYFKIDLETYLKRKGIPADRLEEEPIEFFKSVIDNYDIIMNYEKQLYDVITIDATKSEDEVYEQVKENLIKYI